MIEAKRCFIMLCSLDTEAECLERNLFGDRPTAFQWNLNAIQAGDLGFLLNYRSDELIGIFEAVSAAQLNIEPDAWGGRFPAQVRVRPTGELQRVANASNIFRDLGIKTRQLKNNAVVPKYPVHSGEVVEKLLAYFRNAPRVEHAPAHGSVRGPAPHALKRPTFDDVVGLDEVKQYVRRRMLNPMQDLDRVRDYCLRLGGGLLLYGPPGTGKTFIAEVTAAEIDGEFLELSPAIIRGYPGEPEHKLEEIFQRLASVPRAVLFLDEAEALLSCREGHSSTVMQRIVPTFLNQLAKLRQHRFKPVLVIAATNRPWDIDRAFLRPGRLDRHVYVRPPNASERRQLLEQFLKRRADRLVRCVCQDLELLATQLEGYTPADIELVVDEAAQDAYAQNKEISADLLLHAAKRVPRSISEEELRRYQQWQNS